jgi:hypothetical protein
MLGVHIPFHVSELWPTNNRVKFLKWEFFVKFKIFCNFGKCESGYRSIFRFIGKMTTHEEEIFVDFIKKDIFTTGLEKRQIDASHTWIYIKIGHCSAGAG